ncbi:MAG: putative porin, partial [Methylococcales bacterium]
MCLWVLLICFLCWSPCVLADEKQELLEIKNTTLNLIDALVEEGLLSRQKADALIKKAEAKAAIDSAGNASESLPAKQELAGQAGSENAGKESDVVRVPYVPEFVRDEIRQQVKAELRQDILADVRQTAKAERWGTPDALPEWLSRVKFFGDLRIRGAALLYGKDNIPESYLDISAINTAGGVLPAGRAAFENTTVDRYLGQVRARLGMNISLTESMLAGFRVTTGNIRSPVSVTQSLGNYGSRFQIDLDWAYLQYEGHTSDKFKWLTLQAGRMPNPWFYTNLVWDDDLSFEGLIAQFRADLGSNDTLYELDKQDRSFFLTTGIIPLQE